MSTTLHVASAGGYKQVVVAPSPDGFTLAAQFARLEGTPLQCLAVDPGRPEFLAAGTVENGFFTSFDGGETWQEINAPGSGRIFSVAISGPDRHEGHGLVYAGTEPSALYRAKVEANSGSLSLGDWEELETLKEVPSASSWSFPPRPHTSHVHRIALDHLNPSLIYAGIESGALLRSRDRGATWDDRIPSAYRDCHGLATHPDAPGHVYMAAGEGAAMSSDARDTLPAVDEGMDRHYCWAITVDRDDPGTWYVSASPSARYAHHSDNDARCFIFRKRGSDPWEKLAGGLPQPSDQLVTGLAADPYQAGTVYAMMRDGQFWASRDGGDTWQELAETTSIASGVRELHASS